MRSSGLYPVDRSNQPRNVNRWRPLALLPSTLPVNVRYSSFPFLTTWPTKRICLVTIVDINCRLVLARRSTSSFRTLSFQDIFNIRRRNHISVACRQASIVLLIIHFHSSTPTWTKHNINLLINIMLICSPNNELVRLFSDNSRRLEKKLVGTLLRKKIARSWIYCS